MTCLYWISLEILLDLEDKNKEDLAMWIFAGNRKFQLNNYFRIIIFAKHSKYLWIYPNLIR